MINASQALYLLGSSVNLCCGPTVLAFANEEEAQHFQLGFGGSVYPMEAAIQELKKLMKL
jgi:nitrous oxide reductase accessory protein NosL